MPTRVIACQLPNRWAIPPANPRVPVADAWLDGWLWTSRALTEALRLRLDVDDVREVLRWACLARPRSGYERHTAESFALRLDMSGRRIVWVEEIQPTA